MAYFALGFPINSVRIGLCLARNFELLVVMVGNNNNNNNNLFTPWSRILLEKLTGSAASHEIPRIFGTRRFITVLTSARHLSLS